MIEIGVPVGGTLLTVIVMILVATGIFKCWKRCLNVDLERQPLISCECMYCVCVCVWKVFLTRTVAGNVSIAP